jgi:hypothetical protein
MMAAERGTGTMAEPPKPGSKNWRVEFEEMGPDRVRSMLRANSWDRDKKAAARVWIETHDALSWQQTNAGREKRSLTMRLRSAKWWKYATPIAGLLIGFGLVLRRLKAF